MRTNILLLLIITIISACSNKSNNSIDEQNAKLYQQLDSLLDCQQNIITEKEKRIKIIKDGSKSSIMTTEHEYNLNNQLYDEYMAFNFDSAHHYISRNITLLKTSGDPTFRRLLKESSDVEANSRIRMAHILSVSALFDKAEKTLKAINPNNLSTECKLEYYDQCGELYLYRSELAQSTPFFTEYIDSAQYYRQLILQIAPRNSFQYIFNNATYTCEKGNIDKGINILENHLKTLHQGDRRYSIVASTLAYFYSKKEQPQMQEHYLLLSAISDVSGSILENNSMRELSTILLKRKNFRKAFAYLQHASNDARTYGSRLRSLQAARMAPVVIQAYDDERSHILHRTNMLLAIISVVSLLLVGTVIYIVLLAKKRRLANSKIQQINKELSDHNQEIRQLNQQMKEANRIKDEYIGRFLELCSALLHNGEERHKQLNRLAREHKMDELYAEMKNMKPINNGKDQFYTNFDTAFLNIYPNFIGEVNKLMEDNAQFDQQGDNEKMNTELRVLALIRLGITDNQKIADILRSSLTTIYTYRSKMKARAKDKDSFEGNVKSIGTY